MLLMLASARCEALEQAKLLNEQAEQLKKEADRLGNQ